MSPVCREELDSVAGQRTTKHVCVCVQSEMCFQRIKVHREGARSALIQHLR